MVRRSASATAEPPATSNGHGPSQAITAAAQRVGAGTANKTMALEVNAPGRARRAAAWQDECWGYADAIGEVGYGISQMAGAMSKARLFIGYRPSPKDHPVEALDENRPGADVAAEMLDRLESSPQGLSGLLYEGAYNYQVAGEFYVVGEGTGPGTDGAETWDVRSVDEVTSDKGIDPQTGERTEIVSITDEPGAQPRRLDPNDSFVSRLWRRHPRYGGQATSPMRAIRTEFDELLILSRAIRAAARARIGAGILFLPTGLKVVPLNPTDDATPGRGAPTLGNEIMESMLIPIADEGSASAVVPLIVEGEKDLIAAASHLTFDRPIDEIMAAQRTELLLRINSGMNWPVEIGTGIGKANDWSAFAITQSMFDSHVQPELVLMCQGLWTGVVRPLVLEALIGDSDDPATEAKAREIVSELFLWFDPTNLISKPSVTSDILNAANGRFPYVNAAFIRKELGAGDDDACSPKELAEIAAFAAATARKPTTTDDGEDIGAMPAPVSPGTDPVTRVTGGPPAPTPTLATASAIAASARSTATKRARLGPKLGAIDSALFARLDAAASAALTRALEKAGNRIRNQAKRDGGARATVASGVPSSDVAATLGPSIVATLCAAGDFDEPDLLDGAFDDLGAKFSTWTARAQAQALAAVADAEGIDPSDLDDVTTVQTDHRSSAASYLSAALVALAAARLYDPHPAAPPLGEHDSTMLVPPSLIREAMARAGGAGGAIDADGPTGGVATGATIRDFLLHNGTAQTGWEWSYGDSEREFPGHADLDGVTFAEWTDDVLAVQPGDEWVGETYRPADHDGCRCLALPLYAEDSGEADVAQEAA